MFTSMLDGIKSGMLNRVLVNVGQLLNEGAKDPDMPDWVQEGIDAAHGTLWDSVCREIKEDVMFQCSYKDADFRESMMLFRAQPPSWRREPFVWFRAKVLHTLMPSDGTIWTTVRDPICWAVRVAFVLPVVGSISYVGMFFLIRKTDEYQLINYIVQAKALQSLCVGVPALIQAGIKMWSCLNVLDAITVTADGRVVDEVVDAVVTRACTPLFQARAGRVRCGVCLRTGAACLHACPRAHRPRRALLNGPRAPSRALARAHRSLAQEGRAPRRALGTRRSRRRSCWSSR